MSKFRKVHLFNCDRTYKLDPVEGLLNAMKPKVSFDLVKNHYFSLAEMPDMTSKTIPTLQMDLAIFVVHAHESRLSINEDNAGIGYAKIYRALLDATGDNVIIVIGGDDSYRNEDEEDQVVISRWAKRKISSQFKEEFLDGRKSFIFSWNKKHRPIHEEAMRHFFDPSKKGQKFEYQPKPKPEGSSKPAQSSNPRNSLQKARSMEEQGGENIPISRSYSVGQRGRDTLSSGNTSAEQRGGEGVLLRSNSVGQHRLSSSTSSADQRGGESLYPPSYSSGQAEQDPRSNSTEQRRGGSSFDGTTGTATGVRTPFDNNQATKTKETLSGSIGRSKPTKDLAIFGCNVSETSIQAVRKVFEDIGPKLKLAHIPPVQKCSPIEVKQYLITNHLKFCVLVVDAETVKDAYGDLSRRKNEYDELLKTAANVVDGKVVILICGTLPFESKDHEAIVGQTIESVFKEKRNGFVAWLKTDGKLTIDTDVLVLFLAPELAVSQPVSKPHLQDTTSGASASASDFSHQPQIDSSQRTASEWETGQATATVHPWYPPALSDSGEPVLLKGILRYGNLPYELKDLQIWDPGFTIPDHVVQSLLQTYQGTKEAVVRIVLGSNGHPRWSVDTKLKDFSRKKEIQINDGEIPLFKTSVRYGNVSYAENDVHFRYGNWKIPQTILDSLVKDYTNTPCGELCIILGKDQKLRCTVKVGKIDRMLTFANKEINLLLPEKHGVKL